MLIDCVLKRTFELIGKFLLWAVIIALVWGGAAYLCLLGYAIYVFTTLLLSATVVMCYIIARVECGGNIKS